MPGEEERVRVSSVDAKAGVILGVMRYVLGISLALIVVAFLILFARPFG